MEILIGIIFILAGIVLEFISIRQKKVCTEVTTAKIIDTSTSVDRKREYNSDGSYEINTDIKFFPIYEYYVDGNRYVQKGTNSKRAVVIGQTVEIHYNPNNPTEFYDGQNILPIIAGVIMAIVGLIIIITSM